MVSLLVINYNGAGLLHAALESIDRLEFPSALRETLVVDNGSTDDSVGLLTCRWPSVRLIESPRNLGFAGGAALGIEHARGRYIALLNNDVVLEPEWLGPLVKSLDADPDIGSACGKLLFESAASCINSVGLALFENANGGDRGYLQEDRGQFDQAEDVFGGSGAAVLLRRRMLEDTGGIDSAFYMYYEDLDLAWRAQLHGWRSRYEPKSRAFHHHGATSQIHSPAYLRWTSANRVLVNLKNGPLGWAGRAFLGLLHRLLESATGHYGPRLRYVLACFGAQLDICVRAPRVWRQRVELRRARQDSARNVLNWATAAPPRVDVRPETAQITERYTDTLKSLSRRVRNRVQAARRPRRSLRTLSSKQDWTLDRVLFLLPSPGGSGGAHSVVQEAWAMRALGVNAQVLVPKVNERRYSRLYGNLEDYDDLILCYSGTDELEGLATGASVLIGTVYHSMCLVGRLSHSSPSTLPAYYVQDYEPWFHDPKAPFHEIAVKSYTRVRKAVLFAKTHWLADLVRNRHGVQVDVVPPSLDRHIFNASHRRAPRRGARITAMVRPETPRRAAEFTMMRLRESAEKYGNDVRIQLFGCDDASLHEFKLPTNFRFTNHGYINREAVAALLRNTDIFVDFSTYQAFGRTGLEAMACGAVPILPKKGGAPELIDPEETGFLVDTSSARACSDVLSKLIEDETLRNNMAAAGIRKSEEFDLVATARAELNLFQTFSMNRDVAGTNR